MRSAVKLLTAQLPSFPRTLLVKCKTTLGCTSEECQAYGTARANEVKAVLLKRGWPVSVALALNDRPRLAGSLLFEKAQKRREEALKTLKRRPPHPQE